MTHPPFEDTEFSKLAGILTKLFPNWNQLAVEGTDPDYTDTFGYDLAKKRAIVLSYQLAQDALDKQMFNATSQLQKACKHKYVAERIADEHDEFEHRRYGSRLCEVCGLREDVSPPNTKYNALSDEKIGRAAIRRLVASEYYKVTTRLSTIQI